MMLHCVLQSYNTFKTNFTKEFMLDTCCYYVSSFMCAQVDVAVSSMWYPTIYNLFGVLNMTGNSILKLYNQWIKIV